MDIQKSFLRQYLYVVAINQGLMSHELAAALERYDKDTFLRILQARIEHLQSESRSETAFFSLEYYESGINSAREAIDNMDVILAQAA
jgi:chromosomal replication initiation ATPase DnaA